MTAVVRITPDGRRLVVHERFVCGALFGIRFWDQSALDRSTASPSSLPALPILKGSTAGSSPLEEFAGGTAKPDPPRFVRGDAGRRECTRAVRSCRRRRSLRGLDLGFELSSSDLSVYKEFRPGDFNVPPPFVVHDSTLTISISTERGFASTGRSTLGSRGRAKALCEASQALGMVSHSKALSALTQTSLNRLKSTFGTGMTPLALRGTLSIGPRRCEAFNQGVSRRSMRTNDFMQKVKWSPTYPESSRGECRSRSPSKRG